MRLIALSLVLAGLALGQTSRPSGNDSKAAWFADRGIEAYPNLINAREMPVPAGKQRPGHMLNAQTRDPQEQVVAFYKSKYPDAKSRQQGTAYTIEGQNAAGAKFTILLMPVGSTTAIQYTTEK